MEGKSGAEEKEQVLIVFRNRSLTGSLFQDGQWGDLSFVTWSQGERGGGKKGGARGGWKWFRGGYFTRGKEGLR